MAEQKYIDRNGHRFLQTKQVHNLTFELRNAGQMSLLPGGSRQRRLEQSIGQRFMIGKQSKLTSLQIETEVTKGGI